MIKKARLNNLEKSFLRYAGEHRVEVIDSGSPFFFCTSKGALDEGPKLSDRQECIVIVQKKRFLQLEGSQFTLIHFLLSHNINCSIWAPRHGFTRLRIVNGMIMRG